MKKHNSYHLATALLGLFVVLANWFGLPSTWKSAIFFLLGSLVILFSLAGARRSGESFLDHGLEKK